MKINIPEHLKHEKRIPPHVKRLIAFQDRYDDLPDGAFHAVALEHGIHAGHWAALVKWQEKTPNWRSLVGWPEVEPAK